jgi:hypothetical protein
MESQPCRVSNHIGHALTGDDDEEPVEKIDGWEPLERRKPPDGTVINVTSISRPRWPSITEVEQVTTA